MPIKLLVLLNDVDVLEYSIRVKNDALA